MSKKKIALLALLILVPIGLALAMTYFRMKTPTPQTPEQIKDEFTYLLYCPTISKYCEEGKITTASNGVLLGFGGTVPAGSVVKAAINGKMSVSAVTIAGEQIRVIYLDNKEGELRAIYTYKGTAINPTELTGGDPEGYIKVGTEIGKIEGNITSYNTSLLFSLIKGNPQSGEQLLLDSQSFIK